MLAWGVPSGRVHNAINTIAFVALSGVYGYAYTRGGPRFDALEVAAFGAAFFAGTFLLSPDLDLAEGHVSSKRAWGPLGFLWVPYGWVFSHRGTSHSWVVGPISRLLYLALLLAAPAYLAREWLAGWRVGVIVGKKEWIPK